jgi:hypothetical protein
VRGAWGKLIELWYNKNEWKASSSYLERLFFCERHPWRVWLAYHLSVVAVCAARGRWLLPDVCVLDTKPRMIKDTRRMEAKSKTYNIPGPRMQLPLVQISMMVAPAAACLVGFHFTDTSSWSMLKFFRRGLPSRAARWAAAMRSSIACLSYPSSYLADSEPITRDCTDGEPDHRRSPAASNTNVRGKSQLVHSDFGSLQLAAR